MATYLELVNDALEEGGVELDPLTSSTFASPPNKKMYSRYKKWVADAWTELQLARDQWSWMQKIAVVTVTPGVYVENGNRASAPPAGTVFECQDTGATFKVLDVITHEGDWASGTAKATIFFEEQEGFYKLNEYVNEVSPTPAAGVFRIKYPARFNFVRDGQISDIQNIDVNSFTIQSTGGSSVQENDSAFSRKPLVYVPYSEWNPGYSTDDSVDNPQIFTVSPDGDLEFWPRPNRQYTVQFNYTRRVSHMQDWDDVPEGLPADYHPIIYWMAVAKHGEYDSDPAKLRRGARHASLYRARLERNYLPDVTVYRDRFNRE